MYLKDIVLFSLFVGVGSTVVLDLWVQVAKKVTGLPPTDWGVVGRWLKGLLQGHLFLNSADTRIITGTEKLLGWAFHYLVGIAYALLLLVFAGTDFIVHPTIMPVFIIGVCISSIAGLMVLTPCLGGGFCARKVENQKAIIVYVIVAHVLFALGQYFFSVIY